MLMSRPLANAVLSVVALAYVIGFMLWYSATPLGLHPLLDARENLELAAAIAGNALPPEPFYRAPLYSTVLAFVVDFTAPLSEQAFRARCFNTLCHIVSAGLLGIAAKTIWQRNAAGQLAAGLYLLNPVALFFAADALDITFSITLMLAALLAQLAALRHNSPSWMSLALLLVALAGMARSQMLALLLPTVWALWCCADGGFHARRLAKTLSALAPAALIFVAFAYTNHTLSGNSRILPWQGAFNLWAANASSANGRYFVQQERLGIYAVGVNPARREAEQGFRAANADVAFSIDAHNRFWQQKLITDISNDPLRWIKLEFSKLWYLLNNFEQYNNKTYAFHKAQSPWLRLNPIGWALVLGLGVYGLLVTKASRQRTALLGAIAAYAAALLLTYVSARFRLPLVALLSIAAAGSVSMSPPSRGKLLLAGVIFAVASIPLPLKERELTYRQDFLLSAKAMLASGEYTLASRMADQARQRGADAVTTEEIKCVAGFNAWLRNAGQSVAESDIRLRCAPLINTSPVAARIVATLAWRADEPATAIELWQQLRLHRGPEQVQAVAALVLVGHITVDSLTDRLLNQRPVQVALAALGDRSWTTHLQQTLGQTRAAREIESVRQLFLLRRTQ